MKKLSEKQWDYLSAMHDRIWVDESIDKQRYDTFKSRVKHFEIAGYDVSEFERLIKTYDLTLDMDGCK